MLTVPRRPAVLSLWMASLLISSCGGSNQAAAPTQMPPPEVTVETVKAMPIEVSSLLPGRVLPVRSAEVRSRIEGIIQAREFTQGSDVKAGDALFQIDPATVSASLQVAEAAVAKAEADLALSALKAERYASLVQSKSVSKQDYDEAKAAAKQNEAALASAKANLTRAKLDLGYADVRAPISGRIGRALVSEGALVAKEGGTHLATIDQIDTVYVDFFQPGPDLLKMRKKFKFGEKGGVQSPNITIVLSDRSVYPQKGKLLFSEQTADATSESVLLRAEVPNAEHLLLPGMVVAVILEQAEVPEAITVPQRAVSRNQMGAMVMLLGQDGMVTPQPIKTDYAQGDRWIVSEGLKGGEQVIIEGLQKVRPGMPARLASASAADPATTSGSEIRKQ